MARKPWPRVMGVGLLLFQAGLAVAWARATSPIGPVGPSSGMPGVLIVVALAAVLNTVFVILLLVGAAALLIPSPRAVAAVGVGELIVTVACGGNTLLSLPYGLEGNGWEWGVATALSGLTVAVLLRA